jgi:DNA-binding MarR family transcriptional regulator
VTPNRKSVELNLRLWGMLYQTYSVLKTCEDQTFEQYGLTTEQYGLLAAIAFLGGTARVTDIARWLERTPNSITMLVERMVKAGLVKRTRSRYDRREVRVTSTSKGEAAFKPANMAGYHVISGILSAIPYEKRDALLNLLGTAKGEIVKYLNPGVDIEEMGKTETEQLAALRSWIDTYGLDSSPQPKREGENKGKTALQR